MGLFVKHAVHSTVTYSDLLTKGDQKVCLKISKKNSIVTYSDLLELGLNYGLICKTCPFLLDLSGNQGLSVGTGPDLLELGLNYRLICKTCPFLLKLP